MRRLYHRGEWFDEVSPNAFSEGEFEQLLIQNAEIIQANTTIVPFKKTVYGPSGSARADLAMIAEDYGHWVVIEVEMARHGLHGHVIPQIRSLRDGAYTQEHATYLHAKDPRLDIAKLREMLRGYPPDVLILVNKPDDEWHRELRRYGAHMMVFEVFRSESNRHIFAIDGTIPGMVSDVLTELSFGLLPRCLTVGSPAALNVTVDGHIPIFVDDQLTYWERFHTATGVYLTPVGIMPLSPGQKYVLLRAENGQYAIRPSKLKG
jgi:hypothetical protein